MRPLARWGAYWFASAPLVNLAVTRIVVVGAHLLRQIHSISKGQFEDQLSRPAFLYDPLPALHLLIWPIDWQYRPSLEVLEGAWIVTLVAGILALIGLGTRVSLAIFTLGNVFIIGHAYSYGDFHHVTGIVIIVLAMLTLSPSGRVLSIDHLVRTVRAKRPWRDVLGDLARASSRFARWPLLVGRWVLALVYLSAAWAKLRNAGLDWANGDTLQFYMLRDSMWWDKPLGTWLGAHHEAMVVLSYSALLFEATFFVVLLMPRLARIYAPAGIAMHTGTYLTMSAPFFRWIAIYSVFVPWNRLFERLEAFARARWPSLRAEEDAASG